MSNTIYAVQHDPFTRIGVTYEDKGLVVSVYRTEKPVQRIRYWNPSEVTVWFQNNSKASLEGWKNAYHTSGLTGDSFERPKVNDVELETIYRQVPYRTQRDNTRYPSGTCNVTSYAMAMLYFGVKPIEKAYSQIEDNLEYYMYKKGLDRHVHGDLVVMARNHGLDASFNTNVSLEKIRENLRKGYLCIVSGLFTSSGHIVCVVGLKGKDFVVHDPWGDYNTGYKDYNGAAKHYSESTMKKVLIDMRDSGAWVHTVKGVL